MLGVDIHPASMQAVGISLIYKTGRPFIKLAVDFHHL
jgi:hypothetical protein